MLSSIPATTPTILQDHTRRTPLDQSISPADMHRNAIEASRSSRMGQHASPTLHRLSGYEQETHASIRSPAVWLLLCSPIPSSRFSIAQIRTCRHTLGRSGCVVVVGIGQSAYTLKLQESYRDLSLISRGFSAQAQRVVCLFVCLGEDLYPLGNLFSFSSDFAGDRETESLFALADCTRIFRLFLLSGLLQSRGEGDERCTCWLGTRSAVH